MTAAPSDRRAIVTEALRKIDDLTARLEIAEKGDIEPIAVVGMGCRFPGGVETPAQYWRLLQDGASGIVQVPSERWDADAFYSDDHTVPGTICSREGGFITSWRPDEFDAEFFGISPREAAAMDPQQRLLLEVTWEALENAGITAPTIRGTQTSVFVGMTSFDYILTLARSLPPEEVDPHVLGNAANFAAGRLSYFLGAHGPAMVIDTACSSSLVTVHLACQSLRRRESDQALAAGVNLMLSPDNSLATSRWGMLAPDGRCKTFDSGANGYVRSEGCGVVVLKRLSDAVRDGDSVLALVRGSAVNQDGPSSGQTVPSGPAQQAVLRAALAAARLDPSEIDYIEAHGTGTALGDPIELGALHQVFGERDGLAPLVLGSVKTNVGHLEAAAGIAGFIKTVLTVQHGYIPRHLHFTGLTPNAVEGASRFMIAAEGMSWPAVGRARRAGVSSFGVSGTNAHLVVEQAPPPEPVAAQPEPVISTLVISGKTRARIASTAARLADWITGEGAAVPLVDIAHTVNHHRTQHKTFATVCARDRAHAVAGLQALAAGQSAIGLVGPHEGLCEPGTVFVYSGQGSQWAGMGRQLLADEPAFAAAVDELEPLFLEHMRYSLQQVLTEGQRVTGDARVQPVLMGLQLALTALWRSYGVEPDAVIGHSMGEVTAAVVAGALTPSEGLRVIGIRSRLMSKLAGQGAVGLLEMDADAAEKLLADYPEVSLAGFLSPRQTVIAGAVAQVDAAINAVGAQERFARRVNMEVASHTALMDPILTELRSALADLTPKPPTIPFISTVSDAGETPALDADYWVANVRQPVRLHQAISVAAEQHATFIEISPHPTLTHAVTENLASVHHHSVGTLSRKGDDTVSFHSNLNATHVIRPRTLPHPPGPHPVLPGTPWRHTRHWISTEQYAKTAESAPRAGTLLGQHIPVAATPPTHLWQARLTPTTKPYPGSHHNNGVEIIPISVLLQTLSEAAAECGGSALSDVRFEYPIVVGEPRVIQVVADGGSVTVSSSAAGLPFRGSAQHWVRHVTARITRTSDDHPSDPGVAGPGGTDTEFVDESVTSLWKTWGSEGRPFGWSIGSCRSSGGELHADVELTQPSAVGLLDAAIHIGRLLDSANPRLMVPAAVTSVRFEADLADPHGRVEVRRRGGNDEELIVDIAVTAPDGSSCVDVRGLRYAAVDSSAAAGRNDDPAAMVHAIDWQPFSPDDGHDDSHHLPGGPSTIAVLGDDRIAGRLRDGLAHAGYPSAVAAEARYVLYVAGSRPDEAHADCAVRLSLELADLVRGLADRADNHPVTLWIVTRGVRDGGSDAALAQSPVWGTAGVIRAEQPQLWGGLVDLPDGADIGAHLPALSTILRTPSKSILALRDGKFSAPGLAPVVGAPEREPLRCRPDAAYLITGGMGALGLLMAGWLADHGARRVVLAGRTALPPRRDWDSDSNDADITQKIDAIRALEMRGVAVEAVALDIGSRDALQALLDKRDAEGAVPIRGVIHGAGITDAQLFTELEESRLRHTIWPKIAGAQALHQTFPPGSLDFLFLTAAAGAVFGVPGQGAYAAANAYLDGLAQVRHRQGCHTVSQDWVAWRGLGFGADAQIALQELERLGSRPITAEEAFAAWDHLECYNVAQAVMAPLPSSDGAPAAEPNAASPAWSEMPPEDVVRKLQDGLQAILARELRMPEAELELDRPFAELGMNSVMAMSVRRDTEQFVGIELSATMLFNYPTIVALAEHLAKKVLPQTESDSDIDVLGDSDGSVLSELFDSVESAPAGSEKGSLMTSSYDEDALRHWLADYLVTNVGCSLYDIDFDAPMSDLGLGSRDAVVLSGELTELLGRKVSPVEFWQHPTISDLARFLTGAESLAHDDALEPDRGHLDEPIAVIGLGCRFPGGVSGPDEFWQFMCDGKNAITEVPPERWAPFDDGTPEVAATLAHTTRYGGYMDNLDEFDAEFFDISTREAAKMDPQQRMLLEVAWEALEHAGIPPSTLRRSQTGVFAGACYTDYGYVAGMDLTNVDAWSNSGGALSIIANRLSYFLDLRGPSVTVDTACSSSIVALHLASQSLRVRDSDVALAAGVNLMLAPAVVRAFDQTGALSSTGACHAFDADADGFIRGEGCGVVVLKRLGDAVRDGDRVLAVVRGSAVNQDGRSNGLLAPNPAAQMAVLRSAYANAGVPPQEVDYVEAHGTGTPLGDPIEARALGTVLGRGRAEDAPLLIGTVKTNIGHLEAAAGMAGLIKAVLAVQKGRIPQNLHFRTPNAHIPFDQLRLKVVAEQQEWPQTDHPRRAGVSSFGFGGTNAHAVIEQAPAAVPVIREADPAVSTLVLSGKSPERIASLARSLAEWLQGAGADVRLPDVAHTLNYHRERHPQFATVCVRDRAQAVAQLQALADGRYTDGADGIVGPHHGPCSPGTVFVYSGQGSHWAGMGRQLLEDEPVFAEAIAELDPIFVEKVGFSLQKIIANGESIGGDAQVQPVLMGLQLALTELWRSYGVHPDAVIGHSMGEVTAAVVAGALSVVDGLRVIAIRSQLMSKLAGQGAVALLKLDPEATEALIAGYPEVSVAGYISPRETVIAGAVAAVDAVIAAVSAQNRFARRVNMEVASHTAFMDPILGELRTALEDLTPEIPTIPFYSTVVEGAASPMLDADYWVANVRQPALLSQAVAAAAEEHGTFIEISAHPILTHAVGDTLDPTSHHHSVGTLWRDGDDAVRFHTNLNTVHTSHPPQIPHPVEPHPLLPTTPWHHGHHWVNPRPITPVRHVAAVGEPGVQTDGPIPSEWYSQLAWPARELSVADGGADISWLVITDSELGSEIGRVLGDEFAAAVEPTSLLAEGTDPTAITDALAGVTHVLYAPEVAGGQFDAEAGYEYFNAARRLTAAIAEMGVAPRLYLLTRNAQPVSEGDRANPAHAVLWGLGRTLALEHPEFWGRVIDIDESVPDGLAASYVVDEAKAADDEDQVVYRAGLRRVPRLQQGYAPSTAPAELSKDSSYLVIGATGNIGPHLIQQLAESGAGTVVAVSRNPGSRLDDLAARLAPAGTTLVTAAADAADESAMSALFERFGADLPPLAGIYVAAFGGGPITLLDMTSEDVTAMFRPKLDVVALLHRLSSRHPVDQFVLFSSISGLTGSRWLAHYAATTTFLDTFALARRAAGLPATAINWGLWKSLSDGQSDEERQVTLGSGLQPMSDEVAIQALPLLTGSGAPARSTVVAADWGMLATAYRTRAALHIVDDLLPAHDDRGDGSTIRSTEFRDALRDAEPTRRRGLLVDHVTAHVVAAMGLASAQLLDPSAGFFQSGMDSLMSVTLQRALSDSIGEVLPASVVFDYPTVDALSDYLASILPELAEVAEQESADAYDDFSDDELLKELSERLG